MPSVPDLEDFKASQSVREANKKAFEEARTKLRALADSGHDVQTMRNWTIKSLVGFNINVLKHFGTYYPDMEDDFLQLSYDLDKILAKCRRSNQKITHK